MDLRVNVDPNFHQSMPVSGNSFPKNLQGDNINAGSLDLFGYQEYICYEFSGGNSNCYKQKGDESGESDTGDGNNSLWGSVPRNELLRLLKLLEGNQEPGSKHMNIQACFGEKLQGASFVGLESIHLDTIEMEQLRYATGVNTCFPAGLENFSQILPYNSTTTHDINKAYWNVDHSNICRILDCCESVQRQAIRLTK